MIEISTISIGCRSNQDDARLFKWDGYEPYKFSNSKNMIINTVTKSETRMIRVLNTHEISERDFEGVQACVCSILFKKSWDLYYKEKYYLKYDLLMRFLLIDVHQLNCVSFDSCHASEVGNQFDLCSDVLIDEIPTALANPFGKISSSFKACSNWNERVDNEFTLQMGILINIKKRF